MHAMVWRATTHRPHNTSKLTGSCYGELANVPAVEIRGERGIPGSPRPRRGSQSSASHDIDRTASAVTHGAPVALDMGPAAAAKTKTLATIMGAARLLKEALRAWRGG
jgi:hypothetical protein